jgi:hypothetical protein
MPVMPPAGMGVQAAIASIVDGDGKPTGISIRMMFSFDRDEDTYKLSGDILYGWKVIDANVVFELRR